MLLSLIEEDDFISLFRDFKLDKRESGFPRLEEVVDFWNSPTDTHWVEFPVGEEYWIPFCW